MRRRYGASAWHLLGHLAVLAIVVYAIDQIFVLEAAEKVLLWMAAAILVHDVVLWPLYSGADRTGRRWLGAHINYVRVPLALSLLLALAFAGTVTGSGEPAYHRASGGFWDGYLLRWLLLSILLFSISGLVFLLRRR